MLNRSLWSGVWRIATITLVGVVPSPATEIELPHEQHPTEASSFSLNFFDFGGISSGRITRNEFSLQIDPAAGTAGFLRYDQDVDPLVLPGNISTGDMRIEIRSPKMGTFDRTTGEFTIENDDFLVYFDNPALTQAYGFVSPVEVTTTTNGVVSFETASSGASRLRWEGDYVLTGPKGSFTIAFTCSVNGAFTLGSEALWIMSTDPAAGIDPRQPFPATDDSINQRTTAVTVSLNAAPTDGLAEADLGVHETGGDGVSPWVRAVRMIDDRTYEIDLSEPIEEGTWTTLTYNDVGICLGSLPGDVNANRISDTEDINVLAANLRGELDSALAVQRCDLNHSGACTPADIIAGIDLLNGAGRHFQWNLETLIESPCSQ